MKMIRLIAFATLLIAPQVVFAQYKPGNVCYISDNRIYFQLDSRWPAQRKGEISRLFSLDSTLIEKAFQTSEKEIQAGNTIWSVSRIDHHIVEISKQLEAPSLDVSTHDVLLLDEELLDEELPRGPEIRKPRRPSLISIFRMLQWHYGVNDFQDPSAFSFSNDTATFLLKEYTNARRVVLSGTFNNWSTRKQPMRKTSEGWTCRVHLKPGKYLYKYIVDGQWVPDPVNNLEEYDGQGGLNSAVYCYNHIFRLAGYPKAKRVYVAGSFNNWNRNQLPMRRTDGGWELPMFLNPGTHAYKYIVDRKWITDPGNPVMRDNGSGSFNSYLGIGDTMTFRLSGFKTAGKVYLAGSFNGWNPNELLMDKTDNGWELAYHLAPGIHEYKFIADGQWMTDPANPASVREGVFENSVLTFKPNYTFTLALFTDAKKVIVTGSFNGWREDACVMTLKNGVWTCPVFLGPGKHTYKFIVDGQWMIDPANEVWEGNAQGTGNSVLWVEP